MISHPKDIIIGLLVAYIVADILLIYASDRGHLGLFGALQRAGSENVLVVLVIAAGFGILAWYLARKSRELFSVKKTEEKN